MKKRQYYARMLVEIGINIQKGQPLFITSQVETADFARIVMKEAYDLGASEVYIKWHDDKSDRIKHLNNDDSVYEEFPMWIKEHLEYYGNKKAGFLSIKASDPEALKGVDMNRMMKQNKLGNEILKKHIGKMMNYDLRWCVASVPSKAWAMKVFSDCDGDTAVNKLWDAIYDVTRMNYENPIEEWKKHLQNLKNRTDFLNQLNLKELHFKNSLGTDLKIGLVDNHIWLGGSKKANDGIEFIANMPTEEVFTMPDANNINGVVYSSKPFVYSGNIIDEFVLNFKDGKVVDYSAKVGENVLKSLLEIDDGALSLGEVALVDYDSPISQSNILFYNTLFDENASCHLAFGRAYTTSIMNGDKLTKEEKKSKGVNESAIHEDFMVGTQDLEIIGIKQNGEKIKVFEDGNYCI